MKFKRMSSFMEFVALVLEKALQEDQLELLIQWGQEIFRWIKRSVCVFMCVHISVRLSGCMAKMCVSLPAEMKV